MFNKKSQIRLFALLLVSVFLISVLIVDSYDPKVMDENISQKEAIKVIPPLNSEIKSFDKSISNYNGIIVSSPIEARASWFPDNSPFNASKNLTFEIQIETSKGNLSLKGNALVPKYYFGNFIYNSSFPELVQFSGLKNQPTINWKYSTDYKEVISNYAEKITDNETNKEEIINETLIYEKEFTDFKPITSTLLKDTLTNLNSKESYLDPDVAICGNLDTANTVYTLNTSVSATGNCFNVKANNVTLDCNGYTINYSYSGIVNTYGVNTTGYNYTTIKNCIIKEGTATTSDKSAIYFNNADYGIVINNTVTTLGIRSYGIYLTTASDNNTLLNNTVTTSNDDGYGIYSYTTSYNSLMNNQVNTSQSQSYVVYGTASSHYNQSIDTSNLAEGKSVLYNYSARNQVLYNNIDFSNTYGQIICAYCENVTYNNITASGDGINLYNTNYSTISNSTINTSTGYGIHLFNSANNNNVSNNTIKSYGGFGYGIRIYLGSSYNNLLRNTITTSGSSGHGIYARSNIDFITISNNTITTYGGGEGIYLYTSDWDTLLNNIINANGSSAYGINILGSNSIVSNNMITTSGSASYGISIQASGSSNVFINNTITTSGTTGHGVYLRTTTNNNSFSGMNIKTNNTGHPFYLYDTRNNFTVTDSILNSSKAGYNDLYVRNAVLGGIWNFTNVTRADGTPITINWTSGGNGTLNMFWYLDINVTNSTGALNNANVTSWDVNGVFWNSSLTASTGLTRHVLLGYTNINNTAITYYSNYTVNTTKTDYISDSQSVNMSNNQWLNVNLTTTSLDQGPNVTFLSQTPSDIDTLNILGSKLDINYTITDTNLNLSTVVFYYKTNSTYSNVMYYQNGSPHSGYFTTSMSNLSTTFNVSLLDNQIYPGVYNYGEVTLENTVHNYTTLTNQQSYSYIEFYNFSSMDYYGIFELMANSTVGAGALRVYYCNSSYTTGNPIGTTNCVNFGNILDTQTFNHTHAGGLAKHQVLPFFVNLTTKQIGTVVITNTSYILLRGSNTGTWYIYNINNLSRTDAMKSSTNNGLAWISQNYTIDSHIYQYNGTTSFYYYVCANDTLNNQNCTSARNDLMELGGLPPIAPVITSPIEGYYHANININYTQSISPNSYAISYYNISLVNLNETFNLTIKSNNSLNLSYIWNSTSVMDGQYKIRVQACDNLSQCSYGYSENFTIDNTNPQVFNLTVNPQSDLVYSGSDIQFNSTITDPHLETVIFEFNGINYVPSKSMNVYNISISGLSAGTYSYRWFANDTANNINNSENGTYTINSTMTSTPISGPPSTSSIIHIPETNLTNLTSINLASNNVSTTDQENLISKKLNEIQNQYHITLFWLIIAIISILLIFIFLASILVIVLTKDRSKRADLIVSLTLGILLLIMSLVMIYLKFYLIAEIFISFSLISIIMIISIAIDKKLKP